MWKYMFDKRYVYLIYKLFNFWYIHLDLLIFWWLNKSIKYMKVLKNSFYLDVKNSLICFQINISFMPCFIEQNMGQYIDEGCDASHILHIFYVYIHLKGKDKRMHSFKDHIYGSELIFAQCFQWKSIES